MNKQRFLPFKIFINGCFFIPSPTNFAKNICMSIFLSIFTTKIKIMKIKLLYLLIAASFFNGCDCHVSSSDLSRIDSLVSAEKYDSAYHELTKIEPQMINNDEDRAHYCLLLTRTSCLTGKSYPPDSVMNLPISFYGKTRDKERLCDAYYYKAEYDIGKGLYEQAIILGKKAENLANQTGNVGQQYKIIELIAYINGICGNYDLELQNAKRTLEIAFKANKKEWIVSSYSKISEAYQYLEEKDSAIIYADKVIEHLNDVSKKELPYFLNSVGFAYMAKDTEKAKQYLQMSLSYRPLSRTMENLAYIYKLEGKEDMAYDLWKQALLVEDNIPPANILYNILQYDLSHNNIDSTCSRLYDIVFIKDSLNNVLKDRTIQKIQQEYDEKAVQEKHKQVVLQWVATALTLVVIILLLLGYIRYRQYKAKLLLAEQQMLIINYLDEINRLEDQSVDNKQQIAELNKKINDLIEQDSPRLYHGKMLYDQVMQNGATVKWTQDDFKCFIDFYKASDFACYARIMRKHRNETTHNIFFLILLEMGKEDKDIRQIMNISQEGIRSIRHRIKKKK